MRSLPERFHEQLERYRARRSGQSKGWLQSSEVSEYAESSTVAHEEEIEALASLARSLQKATPMQVDARFADLLEAQLLRVAAQQSQLRQQTQKAPWGRGYLSVPIKRTRTRRYAVLAGLCVLLLCLGTGVLVMRSLPQPQQTAQAAVKVKQAEQADQAAQMQLQILANVADPTHAQAYRVALTKLNQQIAACAEEAGEVPAGSDKSRATQELTEIKSDTRQILYQLLQALALPERVLTTTELGQLGASVPVVQRALFTVASTKQQAVVVLQGSGIQSGAHLLIDNQEVPLNGIIQNGTYTFTIPWSAQQPFPQLLGIINIDHTAAQTATLTVKDDPNGGDDGGRGGGGHRGSDG